ncbi:SDR family NAD(P)-dependent oxidoreductase [Roseomonas sp. BN140053]|uniref:SDR family NAD(P)-dependent oxidoreductase n=1 Tax=Roseomonas sp. BN140053 TaxID=3391898 RepID=UPI0039E8AF82
MTHAPRTYRRALVTGATSGIGNALARALPADTELLLTGRDAAVLRALAEELSRPGRRVDTLPADLATEAGLDALCAAAEAFGIDLLVCNAGQGPFGNFLDAEEAALRATVSVNVMAPLVLLRRLLPGMLDRARAEGRRAGAIVTASEAGFFPVPSLAAYAASKAFDLSLTEALAAELSREPIDLLALCPTATHSRFAERSGYGGDLPGAQQPGDVARAALRALGRQRTLTLGPLSGSVLAVPALARAGLAQAIATLVRFRTGRAAGGR